MLIHVRPLDPWLRYQMETFSALLALCAGNSLMFSLIYALNKRFIYNREAGDLRRHRAHYDVIVMNASDGNTFHIAGAFFLGNLPVTGGFPSHKGRVMFYLLLAWTNFWKLLVIWDVLTPMWSHCVIPGKISFFTNMSLPGFSTRDGVTHKELHKMANILSKTF